MDLIDEIATDIKKEKQFKILLKILPFILAATIIFIIIIAYRNWLDNKTQLHNAEIGDLLHNAIALSHSANNDQVVDESYDYINLQAKNHARDLAILNKATTQGKDKVANLKLLENIIDNQHYNYIVRDYARILWLSLNIDTAPNILDSNDNIDNKFLQATDYFKSDEQIFFSSANLLKALWLISNKQSMAAKPLLEQILISKYSTITNKDYAQKILANLKRLDYNQ